VALFVFFCVRRYCGPVRLEPPPQSCFSEGGRGRRRSARAPATSAGPVDLLSLQHTATGTAATCACAARVDVSKSCRCPPAGVHIPGFDIFTRPRPQNRLTTMTPTGRLSRHRRSFAISFLHHGLFCTWSKAAGLIKFCKSRQNAMSSGDRQLSARDNASRDDCQCGKRCSFKESATAADTGCFTFAAYDESGCSGDADHLARTTGRVVQSKN
jgi:hypothetical protein